jgi:hypothetical protein
MLENSDIESPKVENLKNLRIGQKLPQIWSVVAAFLELYEMRVSIARGQLHNAKPVAMGVQSEGFGVDRHCAAKIKVRRQIVLIDGYGHLRCNSRPLNGSPS